MAPWGLMLVNLGTPDSASVPDVRRYLREFLSDPRVIDMNPIGRWLLLNLIILPRRPKKSAEAYRTIWTDEGSPLLVHSETLAKKVQSRLGDSALVALAMRYQNPSIRAALDTFAAEGIDDIAVLPLFPQYASATTGSVVEKVMSEVQSAWNTPYLQFIPAFFEHPGFVNPMAAIAKTHLDEFNPDHLLMSFHGLPIRHLHKSEQGGGQCLVSEGCCDSIRKENRNCYRAQCVATARAVATEIGLRSEQFSIAFQSRLGKDPWIPPFTDREIERLGRTGTKRLSVMCPAFTADCLETLEEIGDRARESFLEAGGEAFQLIPCLNGDDQWADGILEIVSQYRPLDGSRPK